MGHVLLMPLGGLFNSEQKEKRSVLQGAGQREGVEGVGGEGWKENVG